MITLALRYWYFIAIGVLVVLLAGQTARVSLKQAEVAKVELAFANAKTTAAQAAQQAEAAARAEEQRRADAARKVIEDAQAQTVIAQADAADAVRAADSLRQRVANARRAAANSAAAAGGQTAADPVGLLAELFLGSDQAQGELARYADSARIAGNACTKSYESLSNR